MDFKINTILFPTDLSETFSSALNTAIAVSRKHQAKMIVLYVSDSQDKSDSGQTGNESPFQITGDHSIWFKKEKMRELEIALANQYKVDVTGKLLTGDIVDTICQVADEEKCDLIVMGTQINSKFHKKEYTSVAFNVIQHSLCPVITIPDSWEKHSFRKIVYPVRLLPVTLLKYDYMKPLIDENHPEIIITGISDSDSPKDLGLLSVVIDRLKLILHENNTEFKTKIIPCKNFAEKVLQVSKEYDADLLVITADIDFEWENFYNSPFAMQILSNSSRPVLSIKPEIHYMDL